MKNNAAAVLTHLTPLAVLLLGMPVSSVGHEVLVHENITLHAALSAANLSQNYSDFLNMIIPPGGISLLSFSGAAKRPSGWLEEGAAREDDADAPGDRGGKRSYNHFYDP